VRSKWMFRSPVMKRGCEKVASFSSIEDNSEKKHVVTGPVR
jgi:hypothetical protein